MKNDSAFAGLQSEREIGWKSKAVQDLWDARNENMNKLRVSAEAQHGKGKGGRLANNGNDKKVETVSNSSSEPIKSVTKKNARPNTAASTKYDKYFHFYRKNLTRY